MLNTKTHQVNMQDGLHIVKDFFQIRKGRGAEFVSCLLSGTCIDMENTRIVYSPMYAANTGYLDVRNQCGTVNVHNSSKVHNNAKLHNAVKSSQPFR